VEESIKNKIIREKRNTGKKAKQYISTEK